MEEVSQHVLDFVIGNKTELPDSVPLEPKPTWSKQVGGQ